MAKDTKLNIVVDNTQAISAIEETSEAVQGLKKTGGKGAKESKKDWGGLVDVFSNLMPRGLQRTIRGFKSTQRSVGRLGKSFKVLNKAMSGLLIGGVIIAIEALIDNWDALTDAISGTTRAQKRLNEEQEQVDKVTNEASTNLEEYLNVINDANASIEVRTDALNNLAKATGVLNGVDAKSAEGIAKINEAFKEHITLIETTERLEIKKARLTEIRNDADFKRLDAMSQAQRDALGGPLGVVMRSAYSKYLVEVNQLENEIHQTNIDNVVAQGAVNKAIEAQTKAEQKRLDVLKEAEDAERKAAAARAKRIALAESNAKFLLSLEKDLNEQILLAGIEDEQKRAEKVLEIRHKEGLEKARIAGATRDQLLLIEEGYALDLAALKERFVVDEEDNSEEILADQEALREQLRQSVLNEESKDREQAKALFEERKELAHGEEELEMAALILFNSEIDAIEVFYRDKKAADDKAAKDKEIADDEEILNLKIKGFSQIANASRSLFSEMEGIAEENSAEQKALAITGILLAQAVSVANAIKTATQSAATPYDLAAGIAIAISSVMSAFIGVKKILSQADAGGLGGDGGGGGASNPTVPLIPLGRQGSPDTNNQAYVVQSQLEGQNFIQRQLNQQTVL
tara:strand:+ start:565 stop:2460 length:1896 start_codon:yes stop_codon:yes gene_type:complete